MTETPVLKIPVRADWSFVPTAIEEETRAIYDNLFSAYDEQRFQESVELFAMRQKRWGVDPAWFKDKVCLDVGCGQGRFVVALGRLGVAKVIGVDINEKGMQAGASRAWAKELTNIEFLRASALDLPFLDNSFDYVICSGVILLCPEPKKGFDELARVVKPGGRLFLSMYGSGGLKWVLYDLCRLVLKRWVPFHVTEKVFAFFGVPPNKRYNLLDDVYTPYTHRFSEAVINQWLRDAKFTETRRVKFERYDYEKWYNRIWYGEGWIQIIADKQKA